VNVTKITRLLEVRDFLMVGLRPVTFCGHLEVHDFSRVGLRPVTFCGHLEAHDFFEVRKFSYSLYIIICHVLYIMSLCKYQNILGVAGKGVHSYRILDTPMFDYIGTILLAFIVTKVTRVPLVITTILMFVLAILLHYLFCVKTDSLVFLGLA
jgi:hypothetical protein